MMFEEPKVELVKIDLNDVITTSQGTGSEETCNGPDAAMNNCSTMVADGFMNG